MLHLVVSRDRKQNTDAVMERIADAVRNKRGGQILIVPEQFSHDAERALCERCGDTVSLYAEVLSFTRLADRVFSVCGGIARDTLDDGGRFTALTLALEQAQPRLKVYAPARTKPELIVQLAAQIEEFKNYGVSGADLLTVSEYFDGAFAQKLYELGLILESYDAVCAAGKADPSSKLERLRDLLWESDYLADKTVYLDGFTDYTGLQIRILEVMLRLERPVTATAVCDDVRSGAAVFDAARDAVQWLIRTAEQNVTVEHLQEPDGQTAFLREHLFSYGAAQAEDAGMVSVYRAVSPDVECKTAAAEIRRLMMTGYRCRDIAVACTDRELYIPLLRPLLEHCEIPAYYTGREDILREPALRAVLAALRSASDGMEPEDVFSFLKSPLGTLPRDACDRLQNYVLTWKISGSQWQKTWTMHPDGYEGKMDDAAMAAIAQLNVWRLQAAEPLLRLKQGLEKAANTEAQVWALYAFLQEIQAEEKLRDLAEARSLSDQRAQELGQLYEICLSAMEQLALVLGDTVRTPEDFTTMLRQLLSQYSLGTIPAALDGVTVGDLASLRHQHKKALLILGAGDGQLPKFSADCGILSDQERQLLEKQTELHLAPDRVGRMDRELATVYDVLCSGAERLCLFFSGDSPSYLVRRLMLLYPELAMQEADGLLLSGERDAAGYLAACSGEDPLGTLLQSLDRPSLEAMAAEIRAQADYVLGMLSPDAVESIYKRVIQLSASKIDLFSACRCAYFLQYGLYAKERKEASVDAPIFGTFVHFVLEQTARQVQEEGGFRTVAEDRLQEIVQRQITTFTAEQIGEMDEKDPRFRYLYERNLQEIREVAQSLGEELQKSEFTPAAYELDFMPGGTLPPVEITGKTGSANVVGFVDRVDLYHAPEADYVRVVDYKTGKKAFSYSDVLNGMGMQMLIYLFALQESGRQLWGREVRPAGVLYFPARIPVITVPERPTEEEALAQHRKEAKRSGLLLDDQRLLHAMERFEDQPEFLPCKTDKEGNLVGDLANGEQMRLLRTHVRKTLEQITDAILEGNVRPNPYFQGSEKSACRFCSYAAICHLDSCNPDVRYFSSKKAGEFWERLEGEKDG